MKWDFTRIDMFSAKMIAMSLSLLYTSRLTLPYIWLAGRDDFIKSMTMILTCNKIILFYLFSFWDSELIIPLLPSISSLSNLPDPSPHSSSKPWPYFPPIAFESTYIHAYAYILPNISCSNHILLLMCMFTGLTLWYWIAN